MKKPVGLIEEEVVQIVIETYAPHRKGARHFGDTLAHAVVMHWPVVDR